MLRSVINVFISSTISDIVADAKSVSKSAPIVSAALVVDFRVKVMPSTRSVTSLVSLEILMPSRVKAASEATTVWMLASTLVYSKSASPALPASSTQQYAWHEPRLRAPLEPVRKSHYQF